MGLNLPKTVRLQALQTNLNTLLRREAFGNAIRVSMFEATAPRCTRGTQPFRFLPGP
jgi:hypothetical protein